MGLNPLSTSLFANGKSPILFAVRKVAFFGEHGLIGVGGGVFGSGFSGPDGVSWGFGGGWGLGLGWTCSNFRGWNSNFAFREEWGFGGGLGLGLGGGWSRFRGLGSAGMGMVMVSMGVGGGAGVGWGFGLGPLATVVGIVDSGGGVDTPGRGVSSLWCMVSMGVGGGAGVGWGFGLGPFVSVGDSGS